jgi:thioredoxin-like negative regulator of GroEL
MEIVNQMSRVETTIKIRIFGSEECHHCAQVKLEFSNLGIVFDFIDANADDTQSLCDENNIDVLPHIQAIRDGKIINEHSGPYSAHQFLADVSKKVSKGSQLFPDIRKSPEGCSSCKKKT